MADPMVTPKPDPDRESRQLVTLSPNLSEERRRYSAFLCSYADGHKRKKRSQRRTNPRELQRVTSISPQDLLSTRAHQRRVRVLYDSLRLRRSHQELGTGIRNRADLIAASEMQKRNLWLHRDRRIVGFLPGVNVGDVFPYRTELCVVGLHGQIQAGIDYLPASLSPVNEPIATSIVVSGGYEDDVDSGQELIYTGSGGREGKNITHHSSDQKLEDGNLALERSHHYGIEIRVIRGIDTDRTSSKKVYVYDGLYKIAECWIDKGKSGFSVFKYRLLRLPGQEEMGSPLLKGSAPPRPAEFFLTSDLSGRRGRLSVPVFNDIDGNRDPLTYEYLIRPAFPNKHGAMWRGCRCKDDCSSSKCDCVRRNGGEAVYDKNGILLRGKPLVYECGRQCQCSSGCGNRISQQGPQHRLEIFRSRETDWGVRPLDFIRAGEFICEMSGIVLSKSEAEAKAAKGNSLVYPGRFPRKWEEWGDLSLVDREYVPATFPVLPELEFAMDVSRSRNVACYLSHSSYPNVFVQFVLFDRNDAKYPRVMIFAMENIPPMRELSLDYGTGNVDGVGAADK